MNCNNNLIKNIAGILLVNCEKAFQTFEATLDKVNEEIVSKGLIPLRWYNPDSMAANNTDATIAQDTAGRESVEVNPMRVGFTAIMESVEGTLIKALGAKGSAKGYLVDRNGSLWASYDSVAPKLMPVTVKVISVSLPNGISVSGTNLPAVQVTVDLGTVNEVADFRIFKIEGADSADDYLAPEVADFKLLKTSDLHYTMKAYDLMGNIITSNTAFEGSWSCSDTGATWNGAELTVTAVPFTLKQDKLFDGFTASKETILVNE